MPGSVFHEKSIRLLQTMQNKTLFDHSKCSKKSKICPISEIRHMWKYY